MSAVDPDVLQEDFTLLARAQDAPLPVMPETMQWYNPLLAGIGALLLLSFLWLRLRGYRNKPRPGEKADVIALRELAQWQQVVEQERYREAVASVSAISRRYVEGRFGLRAPTLTTEEFWEVQRAGKNIPAQFMTYFERFLASIDVIKYAGDRPTPAQYGEFFGSTVQFVQSSRKRGRGRT